VWYSGRGLENRHILPLLNQHNVEFGANRRSSAGGGSTVFYNQL